MRALLLILLCAFLLPAGAEARSTIPAKDLGALAFTPHPGTRVPRQDGFLDDGGRAVTLARYLGRAPVVLILEYLHCPGLCGLTLGDLASALSKLGAAAGDYRVLAVSIDPKETPADGAAARRDYAARYPRYKGLARWHFLTTRDPGAIARLARAVGFPYRYDPGLGQYAHPAGITILAPDGRIARYILGVDYQPRDLRLALADAAAGRAAAPLTRLLLLCYGYDPETGRYSLLIGRIIQIACGLTVLAIGIPIALALRREMRARRRGA